MAIREEIEKLPVCETPSWDDVVRRDDVLSILDQHLGECVAEHFAQKIGVIIYATEDDEYCMLEGISPGNHISIYVKRKR